MNGRPFSAIAAIPLVLSCVLLWPMKAPAQSMADYASTPPFVANVVPPNVLFIMDNSGSMSERAYTTSFVATTSYTGYFDPLKCYTYDKAEGRFEPSATPKSPVTIPITINGTCPGTEWDGNFLNWATFRRFDALKKAMTGGDCNTARNADGTCPTTGSPALKTIAAVRSFQLLVGHYTSPATPKAVYTGRMPTSATSTGPANLYIHLRGQLNGSTGLRGVFCVDDDITPPAADATSCSDGDFFTEQSGTVGQPNYDAPYQLQIGLTSEPTGVIQKIGSKARFGLLEFKGGGNGGKVLTGIGSHQTIDWSGSSVENFNNNMAAMLDAVGESFPAEWTPLSEALYDGIRYIAQINSVSTPGSYTYPIAFSGGNSNGVAYQTAGVGSIGTAEQKVLSTGESCPSTWGGGNTGYITDACGRDPYFYGSNHNPAWASQSSVINCCKTFIVLVTDGEPTQDNSGYVHPNIRNFAHPNDLHGKDCTGGSQPYPAPSGTCNNDAATPASALLAEHKQDYTTYAYLGAQYAGTHYLDDVAYWAHITDLRPNNTESDPAKQCNGGVPQIANINENGHCIPGMQNVTVYTFFTFGAIAGRELLMHTAKLGAFEDIDKPGDAGYLTPDKPGEWDKEDNYTGASTGDGIPDAYFESSNADDIQDKLLATITSILRKSSSGTSVSVLATSSTGEGALFQSYFYPNTLDEATLKDVKWSGFTQALFLDAFGNLREDTDGDGKLIYKKDKIIKNRYDPDTQDVRVDKYVDDNPEDGRADSTTPTDAGKSLGDVVPIWEAGKRLALMDASARKLLTWVDADNDGIVDTGEQIAFTTANKSTLAPYLRAEVSPSVYTDTAIINFIRGCEPAVCAEQASLRNRQLQVPAQSGTYKVWKFGDPIHATPTVVGAPKERYDVIYGDSSYTAYYQQYRNRRQTAYVGANDGMLHAFSAGYYHRGDDLSSTNVIEHGWFTRNATDNNSGPLLGQEMWGFIPYQLLPHLKWLTRADYSHVYYVDLKPKITDARIFTADADHPNGWGTILIGGFRLGGSCGACQAGSGAPEMKVTADFGSGVQTRSFYTAYFVLDITNPDVDPKLLMSFSDSTQGLSTSYPTVVRVNPTAGTDNTNAKWLMLIGSGPTAYDGISTQKSKVSAVNLVTGPGAGNSLVTTFSTNDSSSFMGDLISVDVNLDYRADVIYAGNVMCHQKDVPDLNADGDNNPCTPVQTPNWIGKLYRLTTGGGSSTLTTWGVASGVNRVPSLLLGDFACAGACTGANKVGPIVAAPTVTADDTSKVWVFFGTGRYFSASDKTNAETQYFFGVKDPVLTGGCTESTVTSCEKKNLLNMSSAKVCTTCASGTNQVTGVASGVDDFSQLVEKIQGNPASGVPEMDGWYTTLAGDPNNPTPRERNIASPTLVGGIVFFPTFVPLNDICSGTGDSYLYALFYKTGSAYKEAVIGTYTSGSNTNSSRSVQIDSPGLASSMAIQIGGQGSGNSGGTSGSGCTGRITGFIQSSTGTLNQVCTKPALSAWSRYVSWMNQRL